METRVSKHFVIPLNFACLMACLLSCLLMSFFFVRFVVRALCRCGCTQNFANFYLRPPSPPRLHHHYHHHHHHHFYLYTAKTSGKNTISLPLFFFFLFSSYPQFSLKHKWQLYEISARQKLGSVPFSSLHLVIGHLEKSFPESIL